MTIPLERGMLDALEALRRILAANPPADGGGIGSKADYNDAVSQYDLGG